MANTAEDATITGMFRDLDALKAAGKESSEPGSEYMRKLYQLRDATTNRLAAADTESDRQPTAKRRAINRHQERSFKQQGRAICG